ncbi:hypothetical protein BJF85_05140 [Saccharomonospora sp. CUA-673]|nr:hypothetical protein BJF85_05140 [Saccharomonospora sp. CUA-673]
MVRLGITSGGADPIAGWAVGLQERTVCEVSPNDKRPSARDLVEYIAWIRSRGEAGVVVISEHGDLGLDTFNDLPI